MWHFIKSSQCLSSKSAIAIISELTVDTFLGAMSTSVESSWIISIKLEGIQKLDNRS